MCSEAFGKLSAKQQVEVLFDAIGYMEQSNTRTVAECIKMSMDVLKLEPEKETPDKQKQYRVTKIDCVRMNAEWVEFWFLEDTHPPETPNSYHISCKREYLDKAIWEADIIKDVMSYGLHKRNLQWVKTPDSPNWVIDKFII